jgi:hypothetical protein
MRRIPLCGTDNHSSAWLPSWKRDHTVQGLVPTGQHRCQEDSAAQVRKLTKAWRLRKSNRARRIGSWSRIVHGEPLGGLLLGRTRPGRSHPKTTTRVDGRETVLYAYPRKRTVLRSYPAFLPKRGPRLAVHPVQTLPAKSLHAD